MDRRNAIRNMILFGVAPAFVANGLMRIKPIISVEQLYKKIIDYAITNPEYLRLYQDDLNFYNKIIVDAEIELRRRKRENMLPGFNNPLFNKSCIEIQHDYINKLYARKARSEGLISIGI